MAETRATAEVEPRPRAPEPRTSEPKASRTKEWPQVGDAVRFHAGAASGWKSGKIVYVSKDSAVVIELENKQTVARNKGEYEPADGMLPDDRHVADAKPADMVMPVEGPKGPIMAPGGV